MPKKTRYAILLLVLIPIGLNLPALIFSPKWKKTPFSWNTLNTTGVRQLHNNRDRAINSYHKSLPLASLMCAVLRRNVGPVKGSYRRPPEITSMRLDSSFNGSGRCVHYEEYSESRVFRLVNDTEVYFKLNNNRSYLIEGTGGCSASGCQCATGWHGEACSVPSSVWYSNLPERFKTHLKPTHGSASRRIIHAFPFNIEFAMLEARLAELGDIVDLFLILESNYTAYGRPKPYRLLEALCEGSYKAYSHKIVHVRLDHFPKTAYENGWIADALIRNHLSQYGLHRLVSGYRQDDLFLLTDADELPLRETVLFLKLHTGYPEPVAHSYRQSYYGFFWQSSVYTALTSTVSVGILTRVLDWRAYSIRHGMNAIKGKRANLNKYLASNKDSQIFEWTFGNHSHPAGWHCSWCFSPEGIRNKLMSAQNGDFPRWGDFPEKTRLQYIEGLINKGEWFDGVMKFNLAQEHSNNYAPKYLMIHCDDFKNILIYRKQGVN